VSALQRGVPITPAGGPAVKICYVCLNAEVVSANGRCEACTPGSAKQNPGLSDDQDNPYTGPAGQDLTELFTKLIQNKGD
jgi:hypothetical protein